jgi:hypothetical protein
MRRSFRTWKPLTTNGNWQRDLNVSLRKGEICFMWRPMRIVEVGAPRIQNLSRWMRPLIRSIIRFSAKVGTLLVTCWLRNSHYTITNCYFEGSWNDSTELAAVTGRQRCKGIKGFYRSIHGKRAFISLYTDKGLLSVRIGTKGFYRSV